MTKSFDEALQRAQHTMARSAEHLGRRILCGDPHRALDSAALRAVLEAEPVERKPGEDDAGFVKRVVRAYLKAEAKG